MEKANGTALQQCRFLDEGHFDDLYLAFTEAFSDYVIPFALTEQQFRNHINLTGVNLKRTVGCFDGGRIVGFSLNGFGLWNGKSTAYDAGTGVIPGQRRQGISERMFELMLPEFEREGIEQFLLEVITTNTNAINLYRKLGFETGRLLALMQRDEPLDIVERDTTYQLREIDAIDWPRFSSFWDAKPAWQNSIEAIDRSNKLKRVMGAFSDDGECVGYAIFSSKFGRIAQIAVDREHRRRGVGTQLIKAVENETAPGFSLQVINIDTTAADSLSFYEKLGFYQRLKQYEMLKAM